MIQAHDETHDHHAAAARAAPLEDNLRQWMVEAETEQRSRSRRVSADEDGHLAEEGDDLRAWVMEAEFESSVAAFRGRKLTPAAAWRGHRLLIGALSPDASEAFEQQTWSHSYSYSYSYTPEMHYSFNYAECERTLQAQLQRPLYVPKLYMVDFTFAMTEAEKLQTRNRIRHALVNLPAVNYLSVKTGKGSLDYTTVAGGTVELLLLDGQAADEHDGRVLRAPATHVRAHRRAVRGVQSGKWDVSPRVHPRQRDNAVTEGTEYFLTSTSSRAAMSVSAVTSTRQHDHAGLQRQHAHGHLNVSLLPAPMRTQPSWAARRS